MNIKIKIRVVLLLLFFSNLAVVYAQSEKFIVTLDAGHGAHDPGAKYNGHTEKLITLSIVLKTGKILEKHPDIDVVYTRKTDVFIDLVERANIANRANANIFVSVHCDAISRAEAFGSQTFVMGINKNASNLEVSKRENSVISLEKDYKKNYKGFDINNPESIIGATLLQEQYMENSILLASKIQDKFYNDLGRKNRGVSPAPFMVLHKASMPRVLIETGFISNPKEGNYLDSETGQNEISQAIADAIISYKNEYFGTSDAIEYQEKPKSKQQQDDSKSNNNDKAEISKPESIDPSKKEDKIIVRPIKDSEIVYISNSDSVISKVEEDILNDSDNKVGEVVFKVQIMAVNQKIVLKPKNFKGLKDVELNDENKGLYKYTYGATTSYSAAQKNLQEAKDKGFNSAFLIAIKNGKRVNIKEVTKKIN